MRLVNIEGMTNFEVKTTDGKEYVLLPFKHLYDIPTVPAIPLDKVKQAREEFISKYPKNYMGELELSGRTCYFSLNDVLAILDRLTESEDEE